MFLVVGLGNPGTQYEGTRHNVGFLLLDTLVGEAGTTFASQKFRAAFARGRWEGHDAVFLKPLTFMNVSGSSVQEAMTFFKVPPEKLIVVFDDLDQEPGAVRLRTGGGHGGHNGVRDILAKCGDDAFHRVKIGIGKPLHKSATADWVLGRLTTEERERLEKESFPLAKTRLRDLMHRAAKG
jgi:PTH1 family peptidyl-tRNA hydrolase